MQPKSGSYLKLWFRILLLFVLLPLFFPSALIVFKMDGVKQTKKKKRKNLSLISRWVCVSVAQLENRSDNNWRNKRRWDGAAVIRGIIEQTQRWTNSGMKASPSSYRTGWCNCSSRTSPACAVPSSPSIRPTCWTLWTVTAQWWKQ